MPFPRVRHAVLPSDASSATALVARIRAGDVKAFEIVFYEHYDRLVALAQRYVRSPDSAEEVVQEAFFRLWEARATWVVRTSLRAYLYAAVQHAALNAIRHERIATGYAKGQTGLGARGTMGTWNNEADAAVLQDEISAALDRTVRALAPRTQRAYMLRVDHELSYDEIADVMGITSKAVEKLLARAKSALHEALRPYR